MLVHASVWKDTWEKGLSYERVEITDVSLCLELFRFWIHAFLDYCEFRICWAGEYCVFFFDFEHRLMLKLKALPLHFRVAHVSMMFTDILVVLYWLPMCCKCRPHCYTCFASIILGFIPPEIDADNKLLTEIILLSIKIMITGVGIHSSGFWDRPWHI
jgi:hypothetical protein